MIKKLEKRIGTIKAGNVSYDAMKPASTNEMHEKINEIVDAVNKLETMAKNTNTVLESLVQENNIHEKQIAKLQHDNSEKANCQENVQDKFAEQRRWIGKLCRFWNDDESLEDSMYGELVNIYDVPHEDNPFQCGYGEWYAYCEPVKPDDDIIYKGGDNE